MLCIYYSFSDFKYVSSQSTFPYVHRDMFSLRSPFHHYCFSFHLHPQFHFYLHFPFFTQISSQSTVASIPVMFPCTVLFTITLYHIHLHCHLHHYTTHSVPSPHVSSQLAVAYIHPVMIPRTALFPIPLHCYTPPSSLYNFLPTISVHS